MRGTASTLWMTAGPSSSSSSAHKRTRHSNRVHAVVRDSQGRLEDIVFSENVRVHEMVHLPKIGPFLVHAVFFLQTENGKKGRKDSASE